MLFHPKNNPPKQGMINLSSLTSRDEKKKNTKLGVILFVLEKPYLTVLGQSAWKSLKTQKNVCFLLFQAQKPSNVHFIKPNPLKEGWERLLCTN